MVTYSIWVPTVTHKLSESNLKLKYIQRKVYRYVNVEVYNHKMSEFLHPVNASAVKFPHSLVFVYRIQGYTAFHIRVDTYMG